MKNPATHRPGSSQFNEFTRRILYRWEKYREPTRVRLRDGSIIDVTYFTDDGPDYASIACGSLRWNNDGTSITSKDYDMMELA